MAKRTSVEKNRAAVEAGGGFHDQGRTILEACRELAISEQTYCRWKKEYGTLKNGPSETAS